MVHGKQSKRFAIVNLAEFDFCLPRTFYTGIEELKGYEEHRGSVRQGTATL